MRRTIFWLLPAALAAGVCLTFLVSRDSPMPEYFPVLDTADTGPDPTQEPNVATFGSGCFWCTEAVFKQMKGVTAVVSGYAGGDVPNPTYEQVCSGTTGHAEAVRVTFDPAAVSYPELLEVFWRSHDPTTRDRQGNDVGPQYRSIVFYHSDRQRRLAELYKAKIDAAGVFPRPVVTEVAPFTNFYAAEPGHQDFYARNPRQPYCRVVIGPKLEKLKGVFRDRLVAE